ncbi:spore germination protein GerM [Pullulanibacillus camelliae]|uniref:Spore germination protein GerM n=1 Tax=Pullulanibacillus camelliae TaxID=1707096 RepID=A0A8J2YHA8_9BACL|nr:GerMN domain-containing protein [Pullulanibacillus camelliae]GGE42464.1 spore germination protein GerM [Pullulanibacillus camelliae]
MRIPGKTSLLTVCMIIPLALAGCGIHNNSSSSSKEQSMADKVSLKQLAEHKDNKKKPDEKTAARQLYLVDANGHVTPQVFNLPQSNEVAKQALSYLIQDGPVSDILPDGFQAVIPAGTTFSLNLDKEGTLHADFSKEFEDYKAADEQKIMQSITWTLTQFDNIKRVKLSVNGKSLQQMPVAKTPIPTQGLTRADGINVEKNYAGDITNSSSMIVYYTAKSSTGSTYYVPVTERYDNSEDKYTALIDALKNTPIGDNTLQAPFNSDVSLTDKPVINDKGVATLNFNDYLYADSSKKVVSDEALNCLALTFTNQPAITKVAIEVQGKTQVVTESGKPLTQPVGVPNVNVNKTGV